MLTFLHGFSRMYELRGLNTSALEELPLGSYSNADASYLLNMSLSYETAGSLVRYAGPNRRQIYFRNIVKNQRDFPGLYGSNRRNDNPKEHRVL